ncbi:MAG: hypothetical protein J3R72DRAFT_449523 [Linnemannia gamsii]|nr:MAG: hypothetical protein J3R72DRAFT_449523 [Linnemannia gamsii]
MTAVSQTISQNMNTISACSRTLGITELREFIFIYFDFYDLRAVSAVCKDWNRIVTPTLWRTFNPRIAEEIDSSQRQDVARKRNEQLIRRYGAYIRRLYCRIVDDRLLDVVVLACPYLEFLHLTFDTSSSWVSYRTLERFFCKVPSTKLPSVSIEISAPFLEISLLWSVSQLPHLEDLAIVLLVKNKRDGSPGSFLRPLFYTDFLTLCPSLKSIKIQQGLSPNWPTRPLETFHRRLFTLIASQDEETPKDLEAVLVRRRTPQEQPAHFLPLKDYNLRTLVYNPPSLDSITFREIIKRSPLLTRLALKVQKYGIDKGTWSLISTCCPLLQDLELCYPEARERPPTLSECILLFPRLESICIHDDMFVRDLDFSTLDAALIEHEEQQQRTENGRRHHPLKNVCMRGVSANPLTSLLDLLKRGPPRLESVVIRMLTHNCQFGRQTPPVCYPDLATAPWHCLHSLVNLEMATIRFADSLQTLEFFLRLQELAGLLSLRISLYHILSLFERAERNPSRTCRSIIFGEIENLGLCLPTLRRLQVEPKLDLGREIRLFEARLMIECAPLIEYFECWSSWSSSTTGNDDREDVGSELRRLFPRLEVVDRGPLYEA